ncbi:hypothetical protein NEDG_00269 [Nematocida displodere]|uniref:Cell division control protein 73 C-terminal domain-containing protein n=1 Tax=Nematocida displodere TaxID=1805483 RepID=A0A177EIK0_9MICR|nr:hypothetical protein NEDG_00269 [Nematocida displodere]
MANDNPTAILKKEAIKGGSVVIEGGNAVIGGTPHALDAKSTYTNKRGAPYTLGAVAALYCTREMDHGEYLAECKTHKIDAVSFIDRDRILKDLFVPPVDDMVSVCLPSQQGQLQVQELIKRYHKLKEGGRSGPEYILVPKTTESGTSAVIKMLLYSKEAQHNGGQEVEHTGKRYRVVDECSQIDSLSRVAAVFIDGTPWQFKGWPREITEAMKTIPVFYLYLEDSGRPIPKLPEQVSILKASQKSPITSKLISTAFWSILGHSV